MAQMVAKYEREKKLNVREKPHQAARVIRTLRKGDEEAVKRIENGWAELSDGFANAAYLVIEMGEAVRAAEPATEADGDAVETERDAPEAEPAADGDDEAAELRKMTNPQLYDLAEQSGIKVKKGASKGELIAAILADE